MTPPRIALGIETSCDETAAAVVIRECHEGKPRLRVLSDVVHSQEIHTRYGGVIPELASRAHAEQVVPTVQAALERAGITKPDLVCSTAGPGLVGAVLVGLCFGRAAALGWGIPWVATNHLEGHLLSALLDHPALEFPFLSLVVSGGHTTLYLARSPGDYLTLAETVDDAAGEVYDKVARILNLGYPGGPFIDRLAPTGNPHAVPLPRPRIATHPMNMSFAGLKTAARQYLQKHPTTPPADMAASFQAAILDVLVDRCQRAMQETGVYRLTIGGGVAANTGLRTALTQLASQNPHYQLYLPPKNRCTDNAAMIALAGLLHAEQGETSPPTTSVRPRWPVTERTTQTR